MKHHIRQDGGTENHALTFSSLPSLRPDGTADSANWIGGKGANGDWNNAANWSPDGIPSPSYSVTFATGRSGYTVTGDATISAILVSTDNVTFDGAITQTTGGQSQFLTAEDGAIVTIDSNSVFTGGAISFGTNTLLQVQGTLIDNGGAADFVIVQGLDAQMIDSGALVVDQLYVQDGASFTGPVTLTDGGKIFVDTSSTFDGGFMSLEGNGVIDATAATGSVDGTVGIAGSILTAAAKVLTLTADPAVTLLVSGVISGGSNLFITGGTVELAGDNTYTGVTTVKNGNLQIDTSTAITSGVVFLENGGFTQEQLTSSGTITPGGYAETIIASGASDTVNALAGGLLVFAGPAGALDFIGGATSSTVYGGTGILNATGGAGADLIYGGSSGADSISTGAGNSTIIGGTGATLIGNGAGNAVLIGGGDNIFFNNVNDTGNVTIFGAAGDSTSVSGGAGTINAILDNSNATIYGGTGTINIFTGAGSLAADYVNGLSGGNTAIIGFDASRDVINLFSYAPNAAADALATETISGGNTALILSDNTHIELFGVTNLTMSNFTTT